MKIKKGMFFLSLLVATSLVTIDAHQTFAADTVDMFDNKFEIKDCYDTPIPGGAANPDLKTIKETILDPKGIPDKIVVNGKDQPLNIQLFYKRHIIAYGSPFGHGNEGPDAGETCGMKVYRYMGYDVKGEPFVDWMKKEDRAAGKDYVYTEKFIKHPWTDAELVRRGQSSSYKVTDPTKRLVYDKNQMIDDLNSAIDTFKGEYSVNAGKGNFANKHKYWCDFQDGNGRLVNPNGCIKNGTNYGIVFNGSNLYDFAVIVKKPEKYTAGIFYLYTKDSQGTYWYSSHLMPPKEDPLTGDNFDAEIKINAKNKLKEETFKGTLTISNSKIGKLNISSPCDASKKATELQCHATVLEAGLRITHKDTGKIIYESKTAEGSVNHKDAEKYRFSSITPGKTFDISLDALNIQPEMSGTYIVRAWIPYYKDGAGLVEANVLNNRSEVEVEVEAVQNARVTIEGNSSYTVMDDICNSVVVTNQTNAPLSGNLDIQILDMNKQPVEGISTITAPFSNIKPNDTFTHSLCKNSIKLKKGAYTIHAKIPHYTNLPESTYEDNEAELAIMVTPFIPENTTCKFMHTKYITVINPFKNLENGIAKSCIGWTPNYPSTRIEGGQGTFFYFAYKILPTPVPAYKVTTYDKYGVNQSFELAEPLDKLGSCNLKNANDSKCNMYEPFLYYPAKWESRFNTEELKDLRGPYTAGPHEFYHYMYRGRMLPDTIDFNFKIIDMKGNSNIPLGNGTVTFDLEDECYRDELIDITEDCRLIQFYVPVENAKNPMMVPQDAEPGEFPNEKIHFLNPGEHTFRVEVDEKQMYLYQKDEGAEWQGKDEVYREKFNNETPSEIQKKYVEIHKYDEGSVKNKRWCPGHLFCSYYDDVLMPESITHFENGFKGTLYELTTLKTHNLPLAERSKFSYYIPVNMRPNDSGRNGYLYENRGIYQQPDGTYLFTEWVNNYWDGKENTNKVFYKNIPKTGKYIGFEWRKWQIVGGWIEKTSFGESSIESKYSKYPSGPIKTHTVKTLPHGEIEWVNQDEYKNHCYSTEDGFSDFGTWSKVSNDFKEIDNPAIVCFHDHNEDFHYWKFEWSEVRKFGKDGFVN